MFLFKKNPNTTETIITILSNEFPLTLKQIHYKTNKTKTISNQAIHKTLKQLTQEKILIKKNNQYTLNPQHLKKTIKHYQQTLTRNEVKQKNKRK